MANHSATKKDARQAAKRRDRNRYYGKTTRNAISDLKAAVDAHERSIIEQALARHRYNQRQTAKALGLSYDQLRHCMKKHGLTERGG